MEKILGEIMQMAKQQGFSIALLALAVWWMNTENKELEAKVDLCNQSLIEEYRTNNNNILNVINENKDVMCDFAEYLKEEQMIRKNKKK